jgi:hypothetical protein
LVLAGLEMGMNEIRLTGKLVNAEGLLQELFKDDCRPSLAWLRRQTRARTIPYFKIGRLIFFDVNMVSTYLAEKRMVHGR